MAEEKYTLHTEKTEKTLEQIRDSLGDLPEKLAEHLRSSRQMRFQQQSGGGGGEGETPDKEKWRATEGLLGAASAFVPQLGQLATAMGNIRRLMEMWERFQEAFKPPPTPEFVGPLEPVRPPTYDIKDKWKRPEEDELPWVQPVDEKPLAMKPEGWMPKKELAENEFEVDAETMAEFRAKLNPGYGVDERWEPPEAEKPSAPLSKPLNFQPERFEIADWERSEESRPNLPLANTEPYGLAKNWTPPVDSERPEPLKPLGKSVPEGWEGVKPSMGLSNIAEMMGGDRERNEGYGQTSKLEEKVEDLTDVMSELVKEMGKKDHAIKTGEGSAGGTGQGDSSEGLSRGIDTVINAASRHNKKIGEAVEVVSTTIHIIEAMQAAARIAAAL